MLPVFVHPSCAELTQTGRQRVVVDTNSCAKVAEDEQWLLFWDFLNGGAEIIIEFVLSFCCGSQC